MGKVVDLNEVVNRARKILEEAQRLFEADELTRAQFDRLKGELASAASGAPDYVVGDLMEALAIFAPPEWIGLA